jgi:hypothetical protein
LVPEVDDARRLRKFLTQMGQAKTTRHWRDARGSKRLGRR